MVFRPKCERVGHAFFAEKHTRAAVYIEQIDIFDDDRRVRTEDQLRERRVLNIAIHDDCKVALHNGIAR